MGVLLQGFQLSVLMLPLVLLPLTEGSPLVAHG